LSEEASAVLKELYGREADITVIDDTDIPPEGSGKYLISRTLFPIELDNYLDLSYSQLLASTRSSIK
jgi:hypothetical protein